MDIVGSAEILATLPHRFGIGGADEKPEHHPSMNVVATSIRICYQCLEGVFGVIPGVEHCERKPMLGVARRGEDTHHYLIGAGIYGQ
jgi:hypothetical protein